MRSGLAVRSLVAREQSLAFLATSRGPQVVGVKHAGECKIRLVATTRVKAGEAVILTMDGAERAGRVLWVDRTECSITFAEALSVEDARRLQRLEAR